MVQRTPEGEIKRAIGEYLYNQPCLTFWYNPTMGIRGRKRHSKFERNGTSDILGYFSDGKMFACEVKAPGGRASEDQIDFVRGINMAGGFAIIADSVEKLDVALADYCDENRLSLNRLRYLPRVD